MADWSEIFEKRLQTVLQDDRRSEGRMAVFDLASKSATHNGLHYHQHQPTDPTSSFFESIRRQGGGQCRRPDIGGGPVMTPAAQTMAASPTSDVDTEQSITRLQKSYSNRARDLHGEAMAQLDAVQAALETQLADMAQQAEQFLSAVVKKQAQFGRPAKDWVVKIQTREGAAAKSNAKSAATTQKDERVVDRIAAMREAADTLRSDLARLWEQWEQAQQEANAVLQAMTGGSAAQHAEDCGVAAIMAKAEQELDAAAAEAMQEMRENEKTFKKLIYAEECKIAQTMLSRQSKYD